MAASLTTPFSNAVKDYPWAKVDALDGYLAQRLLIADVHPLDFPNISMVITFIAPAQKVGRASKTPGSILGRHNLQKWVSFQSGSTHIYVDMSFAMVNNQAGQMLGSMAVAPDSTKRFLEGKNMRRQLAELTPKPAP